MKRLLTDQVPMLLAIVEPPERVATILGRLAELDATRIPTPHVPQLPSLIAAGHDPEEARQLVDAAKAEADSAEETRQAVAAAREQLRHSLDKWLIDNASELVEGPVRTKAARILDAAAPFAVKLERFAPRFDTDTILLNAKPAELAAWQASRELNDQHRTLVVGWLALWRKVTVRQRPDRPDKRYAPTRAGGIHAWLDPHLIDDLETRDGIHADVLNVAVHRSNYRLLSPGEMLRLATTPPGLTKPWRQSRVHVLEPITTEDPRAARV